MTLKLLYGVFPKLGQREVNPHSSLASFYIRPLPLTPDEVSFLEISGVDSSMMLRLED